MEKLQQVVANKKGVELLEKAFGSPKADKSRTPPTETGARKDVRDEIFTQYRLKEQTPQSESGKFGKRF